MAKIYYQEDCDMSLLEGKTIAIIGYGSQGHAHALNLKESGCNVIVGLYQGSRSWAKAEAQGFEVYTAAEAAKKELESDDEERYKAAYEKLSGEIQPIFQKMYQQSGAAQGAPDAGTDGDTEFHQ